MDVKVVILGSGGYLASKVRSKLQLRGHQVAGVSRNLSDEKAVADQYLYSKNPQEIRRQIDDFEPECILHLSNFFRPENSYSELEKMLEVNVKVPAFWLAEAVRTGAHFINVGSLWQLYLNQNTYALSKRLFEVQCELKEMHENTCSILVPDVTGRDDWRGKVVNLMCDAVLRKDSLTLRGGAQLIEPVAVGDVCDVLCSATELRLAGRHRVFGPEILSLRSLAVKIERMAGVEGLLQFEDGTYRDVDRFEEWPALTYEEIRSSTSLSSILRSML